MYVEKWLNAPSSYEDTQQLCALLDFLDQELENYHEIFNDVCSTFVLWGTIKCLPLSMQVRVLHFAYGSIRIVKIFM